MIANAAPDLVGRTPLVALRRFSADLPGLILGKLELANPMGSVKDRIGLSMITAAEDSGALVPGGTIVEATSGNTGIALAWIGAARGYQVVLTMPETMSEERQRLLRAFGARLELTAGHLGMSGAVSRAEQLLESIPDAFMARQFSNPANPLAHEEHTGPEIIQQSGAGIHAFVAGVGTGGTLTGVGRALRRAGSDAMLVAVEPDTSAVLSGHRAGPHRIQGIGSGFIPDVLDRALISDVIAVSVDDAAAAARKLATTEGIAAGISAGANLHAAAELANRLGKADARIVTVLCDTGERYLSTFLYAAD